MPAKPAVSSKPDVRRPRKKAKPAVNVKKLLRAAETAELELQKIVSAATEAGGWQPVQADECRRLAGEAIDARTKIAKAEKTKYEPGANMARWLS